MPCPDAEAIAAFVSRSMTATLEAGVEGHIADCADCRRLAFALASADAAPPTAAHHIGRFEVVAPIGSGAMGRVVRARDPELGREVAIKVRHGGAHLDADAEIRLRREAQALARLVHPGVVVVYEVGRHDGAPYVAMEYVEGLTLEAWLATPRTPHEVIDVMVSAGRGLAAAHAAGLVHRDVKPSNIFVTADGAAKIGDFGLARPDSGAIAEAMSSSAAVLDLAVPLSITGALIGTPAYMSPEQLRGETATAASDQFAFCVTLYQALYGRRPFSAGGVQPLLAAIARGPTLPATPRVPARLRRVLVRGLAADPARRFPSMTALLAALPGRRGAARWLAGAGVAAAALVGAVVGGQVLAAGDDPCAVPDARAAGIFAAGRVGGIEAALAAEGDAPAAATVRRLLTDYGQRWEATRVTACRAATQGALSAVLRDGQRVCLDRRLDRVDDLAAVLSAAGAARVGAVVAAEALPDPAACLRVDLRFADREPPAPGAAAVERRIDRLVNLVATGQATPALAEAPAVVAAASAERDPRLVARAHLAHAQTLIAAERYADAEPLLADAARDAARARDDELVAEAWIAHVTLLTAHLLRVDEARRWVPVAEAAALRAGDPPLLRARLREQVAAQLVEAGQFDRARAELEAALAIRAQAQPGAAVALAAGHTRMGALLFRQGRLAEAHDRYLKARDLFRDALGDRHPRAIDALTSIGYAQVFAEPATAQRYLEEARDLSVLVHGKDSAKVAHILDNLGIARVMQGDAGGAAALHREAAAIYRARLGATHRGVAFALGNLGKAQIDQRDYAGAVASYRESADILAIGSGPGDAVLALARAGLGDALQLAGDMQAAAAAYVDSLAAYDGMQDHGGGQAAIVRVDYAQMLLATGKSAPACAQMAIARTALATAPEGAGRNHNYTMLALAGLVTCDVLAGRVDRARLAELDAAAPGAERLDDEVSARVGFARARGHDALGERAVALALARAARDAFVRAGLPERRAEVERWLRGRS
jgi:tRNA A-37 threonylcarbamoyl transferase component Bud32/tetratricopeptide (TPR) repeat protein